MIQVFDSLLGPADQVVCRRAVSGWRLLNREPSFDESNEGYEMCEFFIIFSA